ncbi:hypothetical protein FND50_02250 [Rhodococcus sp. WB9]|uniref:hypothetical protein n=1 Tax=Rhodococcus sp. WB9 TaxID=2594007 RepID=UPI001186A821|nr:hypothetical protein [Rhodococcus sp. WB9]QDQ89714.1 hypothetical protein FND50_02250 [Rhodococcus sp. WB9]
MTAEHGARVMCAAAATLMLASGCGTHTSNELTPEPASQDREVLYSNVWSADQGVDLFGRGAELVRASYEAGDYTAFVGADNSYPGFTRAVGGEAHHGDSDIEYFMTSLGVQNDTQAPGTSFAHITAFESTGASVTATVCNYHVFPENGANISLDPLNMAFRVELARTADDPGQAGVPDTDPAQQDSRAHRVPTWNVFEGWKITKLRYLRRMDGDVIAQGCTDWWQQRFPAFAPNAAGNLVPPAGFEPPTMPVAVQYPEWIGPANSE